MRNMTAFPLVAFFLMAVLPGAAPAESTTGPAGHWEGTIEVPGQPLAIQVDSVSRTAGTWEGFITIPAQGVKHFPLAAVTARDGAVGFVMKGVPGDPTFRGTLSKDGRTVSGDYSQGGVTLPFTLAWKGDAVLEPAAKSTPITADVAGTWEGTLDVNGTSLRLVTTLTNHEDGATGTLVSVDQGGVEIPIATIVQAAGHVTLTVSAVGAQDQGDLKNGQLVGTWKQGPGSHPLVFKRKS